MSSQQTQNTAYLQTDVLVMNFGKAFDKVYHVLLVYKLCRFGIRGKVNRWIVSRLKPQIVVVAVDGKKSGSVIVESGVSPGSVLGPGLFLYYINGLPSRLHSTTRIFADYIIAFLVIVIPKDARLLQEDRPADITLKQRRFNVQR